jgi:hypothetical protein
MRIRGSIGLKADWIKENLDKPRPAQREDSFSVPEHTNCNRVVAEAKGDKSRRQWRRRCKSRRKPYENDRDFATGIPSGETCRPALRVTSCCPVSGRHFAAISRPKCDAQAGSRCQDSPGHHRETDGRRSDGVARVAVAALIAGKSSSGRARSRARGSCTGRPWQ